MVALQMSILAFLSSYFLSSFSFACQISSQSELIERVKLNHPDITSRDLNSQIYEAEIARASQLQNPQVGFSSNHGEALGIESYETNASLLFTFETGGKRSRRIERAQGQKILSETRFNSGAENTLIRSALEIARYSQLKDLYGLYKESLAVFKKIKTSMGRNKSLSPELMIQKDIVALEVSKHQFAISKLASELAHFEGQFKLYAGEDCQINIPPSNLSLPDPGSLKASAGQTPDFRELVGSLALYEAGLNYEKSLSFPDLRIGPSYQRENEGDGEVDRFGLSVIMDLPLFNWNKSGRAKAHREYTLIERKVSFKEKENALAISSLLNTYKFTMDALSDSPKRQELLDKHHRIENFYLRGLISISTMLDGHDELLSLIELKNEHELIAFETLMKIKQSTGELDSALEMWGKR